jgi:hypothetical protein
MLLRIHEDHDRLGNGPSLERHHASDPASRLGLLTADQ